MPKFTVMTSNGKKRDIEVASAEELTKHQTLVAKEEANGAKVVVYTEDGRVAYATEGADVPEPAPECEDTATVGG